MYSLLLSGTPGKGGPYELEEPEEASSLYRKEAEKLEIEVEQNHGNPKTELRGGLLHTATDRRRGIGGTLIGVLGARHCYRKT